eukprot:4179383-Pyramimonas_sp.AAC.1
MSPVPRATSSRGDEEPPILPRPAETTVASTDPSQSILPFQTRQRRSSKTRVNSCPPRWGPTGASDTGGDKRA